MFIVGGLNGRTSTKNDRDIPLFTYANDVDISARLDPDTVVNSYGTKLLQFCKSTGLNGRHKDNLANDCTYNGPNGYSVIDYLIASADVF